jgi:hypothetical protein
MFLLSLVKLQRKFWKNQSVGQNNMHDRDFRLPIELYKV